MYDASSNGYDRYRSMQVNTSSNGGLVIMLYEGALKFMHRAQTAIEQNNFQQAHNNIIKIEDIVLELRNTLDTTAGEVAENLASIYTYMYDRLVEANMNKDITILNEISGYLSELLEAWRQAVKMVECSGQDGLAGPLQIEVQNN